MNAVLISILSLMALFSTQAVAFGSNVYSVTTQLAQQNQYVDPRNWEAQDLRDHIEIPIVVDAATTSRPHQLERVGPILIHEIDAFTQEDQELIEEIQAESQRNGYEVGAWKIMFHSGRTLYSEIHTDQSANDIHMGAPLNDLQNTNEIDFAQVKALYFFHTHPGQGVTKSIDSPGDVNGIRSFLEQLKENGFCPEAHVYAVSLDQHLPTVGHYGDQFSCEEGQ